MQRAVAIAKRFFTEFSQKDLPELAAGLAYRFLFAIFPFGLFVAALTAYAARWLGIADPAGEILSALGDNLPADIAGAVRPELERLFGEARPDLVSIGAIGALWAATGGTMSIIKGTNRSFDIDVDSRSFIHKTALAIGLTLLAVLGVLGSFVTIVGGSFITDQLAAQLGLTAVWPTVSLLRWPLVFVALSLAVGLLYRAAPDTRVPWRWAFTGGVIFTVAWLVVTGLFAWYATNLSNFGATYGALGSVIALMLWFYLTGLILIAAAQLIAVLMAELDPASRRAVSAIVASGESGAIVPTPPTLADGSGQAGPPPRAVAPAPSRSAPLIGSRPRVIPYKPAPEPESALFAGAVAGLGLLVGAVLARLAGKREADEEA